MAQTTGNVAHNALNQNSTNGFAPLNKRAKIALLNDI